MSLKILESHLIFPFSISLDTNIASIGHAHGQLSDISKNRVRMREFYSTNMIKEYVKGLHKTKGMIPTLFMDPGSNKPLDLRNMHICMVQCTFQLFKGN